MQLSARSLFLAQTIESITEFPSADDCQVIKRSSFTRSKQVSIKFSCATNRPDHILKKCTDRHVVNMDYRTVKVVSIYVHAVLDMVDLFKLNKVDAV